MAEPHWVQVEDYGTRGWSQPEQGATRARDYCEALERGGFEIRATEYAPSATYAAYTCVRV